jgi:hypothetical protein
MTRFRPVVSLVVLGAVVSAALAPSGQAGGETPITNCGQVVTRNALLTHALACSG